MELEAVIGLEIHVQLKTKSKMFCRCSNAGENEPPNTTVCPICMGHPGTLPVPNGQAIAWSVMSALALNCRIPSHSKFDRKHYFYPDLPKAYQISQYDEPIGREGSLLSVRIHRLHLEEDAAKLLHNNRGESFVDYNRGGTPLMEIVTEPDIRTPEAAGEFLRELRLTMRYLGVSDADMEKGHLRCDANISMRPASAAATAGKPEVLYPKTEIKNLNSFKAVEKALHYEINRQREVWEETGKAPAEQGTRGWDENAGKTIPQRTKEEAQDYRYFPEPDIPELDFDSEYVERLRAEIPELPHKLRERFVNEYGFKSVDAKTFTQDKALAGFAEKVISELKSWLGTLEPDASEEERWEKNKAKIAKLISTWILSRLLGLMNDGGITVRDLKITPENMAELITLVHGARVSAGNAQKVLEIMFAAGRDPSSIIEEEDLGKAEDEGGLEQIIEGVISANPEQVLEYKSGKTVVLNFLVGLVMKETKGKADAGEVREKLEQKLS